MMRSTRGFTLVELIIVIAVIGLLAAILIPVFSNVINKANAKSALSDAKNTVSQYVIDKTDNPNLPENIVIFVKKANKMYVYGYNTNTSDSLLVSNDGEAFDVESEAELVDKYSFNANHTGEMPDLAKTDYDMETDGAFYLVTYDASGNPTTTPSGNAAMKGFHGTKGVSEEQTYRRLTDEMFEKMGEDVSAYHGVLLGGTYSMEDDGGSTPPAGGGEGGTPVVPNPDPVGYTVTFEAGRESDSDFDPVKATIPAQATGVTTFIPGSYSASYANDPADDNAYTFEGWKIKGGEKIESSLTLAEDITVQAIWTKTTIEYYTLTFNGGEGSLNLNGFENGTSFRSGTEISSYLTQVKATKANCEFLGWYDGDVHVTAPKTITKDLTLTAKFSDATYTLTFKAGEGTGSNYVVKNVAAGSYTLPTFATTGLTAPDGMIFAKWENGVEYGEGATYNVTGDAEFTATYTENKFTVTYDKTAYPSATVPADKKYTVGTATVTLGESELKYYALTGYATTLGGSGLAAGATIDTSSCKAGETVVVTPAFAPKTMNVTFSGGEQTATGLPATYSGNLIDNKTYTVPANVPAADGFKFVSYTVTVSGGASDTLTNVKPGDDIDVDTYEEDVNTAITLAFVAQWEEDAPQVTDAVCYYGNTCRDASGNLDYKTTLTDGYTPVNILGNSDEAVNGVFTVSHTTGGGKTFNRTFTMDASTMVTSGGVNYVKCTETTDWSAISGIKVVEKTAGATVTGSVALSTLNGATAVAYIGSSSNRIDYVLIEDIDWSAAWNTFGGNTGFVYSHFDGMGYAVNAITVTQTVQGTSSALVGSGFFSRFSGTSGSIVKIQNMMLPNARVTSHSTSSYQSVGIVAGQATYTNITNCHTSGYAKNEKGSYGLGGILGQAHVDPSGTANVIVKGCSSTANLEMGTYKAALGGIVGRHTHTSSTLTVEECWYNGNIKAGTGTACIGGIVGVANNKATVNNCWSAGNYLFTAQNNYDGSAGIAGSSSINVTNCYSVAVLYNLTTNSSYTKMAHPICANSSATNCFYINNGFYWKASASGTAPSWTFSGTECAITAVAGATECANASALTSSASAAWNSSVWNFSGTYPELISNPGMPA
ncbi:MAG: prepilin-type N-terminal cleavage/methylation domain-containing protein [Clostridia bacterium]|nr:prepilin-type N-terminal cleavage/methylation domain-containing protein [Clostridia bacterium]